MSEFDRPESPEPFQPPADAPRAYRPPLSLDIVRLGGIYGIFGGVESPVPVHGAPIVPSDSRRGHDRPADAPEGSAAATGENDSILSGDDHDQATPAASAGTEQPEAASRSALQRGIDRVRGLLGSRDLAPASSSPPPVVPGEGDDGPYKQENMVTHPADGEEAPAAELLDEVHSLVRMRELAEQAAHPRPEPVPIPEGEVAEHAATLVGALWDTADSVEWDSVREGTNWDGRIIRTHTVAVPSEVEGEEGRRTHVTLQLGFEAPDSATPLSGTLSIMPPAPGSWPREYHFRVDASSQREGPYIRYDDHPHNELDLGRPQRNTLFALEQARRLIASIPKRV